MLNRNFYLARESFTFSNNVAFWGSLGLFRVKTPSISRLYFGFNNILIYCFSDRLSARDCLTHPWLKVICWSTNQSAVIIEWELFVFPRHNIFQNILRTFWCHLCGTYVFFGNEEAISLIWRKCKLGYLSADIVFFLKRKVFQ